MPVGEPDTSASTSSPPYRTDWSWQLRMLVVSATANSHWNDFPPCSVNYTISAKETPLFEQLANWHFLRSYKLIEMLAFSTQNPLHPGGRIRCKLALIKVSCQAVPADCHNTVFYVIVGQFVAIYHQDYWIISYNYNFRANSSVTARVSKH